MSRAISGVGTKLYRDAAGDSSEADWRVISEVLSISGPTMSRGTIDVTNLDSEGGYREFITGFRDAGDITASINYYKDGYKSLKEDFEADDPRWFKIVLPDGQSLWFEAFVTGIPLDIPLDSQISYNVTFKITGRTDYDSDSSSLVYK